MIAIAIAFQCGDRDSDSDRVPINEFLDEDPIVIVREDTANETPRCEQCRAQVFGLNCSDERQKVMVSIVSLSDDKD